MWAELTWYNSCTVFLHLRFPTPSLQDLLRQWWELRFKTLLAKLSSNSESTVHCLVASFMPSGLCKLRVTEEAGADSPEAGQDFLCTTSSPILRQHWGRRLEPSGRKNEREVHDCTTVTEQRLHPKVCPQDRWIQVTCAILLLAFSRFKAVDYINSMCSSSNLILFHNNCQIMQGLARAFST